MSEFEDGKGMLHGICRKRGRFPTGCGQRDNCSMLKGAARDHRVRGRGQWHAPGASGVQGMQDLKVTGQERLQINPKLKGISLCVWRRE